MRIVSILVFLLGIGIAGFVAYSVMKILTDQDSMVESLKSQITKNVKIIQIPVAASDLKYGKRLTKDDVTLVDWPAKSLPKDAYKTMDVLFGAEGSNAEPRTVLRAMDKGEIISARKVTKFGQDAGLASRLEKGQRAYALRVDVSSAVSGFLRPDSLVDIYWTGRDQDRTVTQLILDGVQLIAIDQVAERDNVRAVVPRTITVSVSPQKVASLAQAQATGKLTMALRGLEDDDAIATEIIIDNDDILIREDTVETEKKKVCTTRIRSGNEITEIKIPCPAGTQ